MMFDGANVIGAVIWMEARVEKIARLTVEIDKQIFRASSERLRLPRRNSVQTSCSGRHQTPAHVCRDARYSTSRQVPPQKEYSFVIDDIEPVLSIKMAVLASQQVKGEQGELSTQYRRICCEPSVWMFGLLTPACTSSEHVSSVEKVFDISGDEQTGTVCSRVEKGKPRYLLGVKTESVENHSTGIHQRKRHQRKFSTSSRDTKQELLLTLILRQDKETWIVVVC
jgi:hypothetical protein